MLELKVVDFKYFHLTTLVIPICQNATLHTDTTILRLVEMAKTLAKFKAKNEEIVTLFYPPDTLIQRAVFIGLGNSEKINSQKLRLLMGKAVNHCIDHEIANMAFAMPSTNEFNMDDENVFSSVAEGAYLGNHVFDIYKKKKKRTPLTKIILAISNEKQLAISPSISKAKAICHGTILARQWVNMPSNDKKPNQFAKLIRNCAKSTNITMNVFDEKWLVDKKLKAILAVGQGSSNKPCLVTMEYKPDNYLKTILLVGKGVTFDSGGINLKPSTGLEEMKTDMAGGAAVAGTLISLSKLKPTIRVAGIIPLVENMPSGSAMRPGDIIKTFLGKTIEIGNTDAEGRLTLVDALAWGISEYKPDIAIDIATLTGACAIALGDKIAGVFSTDNNLSRAIVRAGEKTFERCWSMPIPEDYRELLKSASADLSSTSISKWGGAITAAAFLSEFIGQTPWAHIDIAGPARSKEKTYYCESGATGFGVRLLCELVENLQKQDVTNNCYD